MVNRNIHTVTHKSFEYMSNSIGRIEKMQVDFDKKLDELKETSIRNEEHLKAINGTFIIQGKTIDKIQNDVEWNKTKIILGLGGLTTLSILALTKSVGLW